MNRQTNILEYLENIVHKCPDKTCYANELEQLSFKEVYDSARAVGTALAQMGLYKKPIVVFMRKHP